MPFSKNQPKCKCGHSWTKHKPLIIDENLVTRERSYCKVKGCECRMYKWEFDKK